MEYGDIAREMGTTANTVAGRYHRTLKLLRRIAA
jgi:DNA-directed RNA polymerase specialized sigma24 family protein